MTLSAARYGRSRAEISRIRRQVAFRRFELAAVRHGIALRKYDPNPPRVPAGSPEGGQWTDGGGGQWTGRAAASEGAPAKREFEPILETDSTGAQPWETVATAYDDDGAIVQQAVTMRDGSYIRSSFADAVESAPWDERHTVALPGGGPVMFETAGNVQTIKDKNGQTLAAGAWTSDGAEPEAFVQPAFAPPVGDPKGGRRGHRSDDALHLDIEPQHGRQKAVFAFNASAFVSGAKEDQPALWVGKLSREEVDAACRRHDEVQSITDQSVAALDRDA